MFGSPAFTRHLPFLSFPTTLFALVEEVVDLLLDDSMISMISMIQWFQWCSLISRSQWLCPDIILAILSMFRLLIMELIVRKTVVLRSIAMRTRRRRRRRWWPRRRERRQRQRQKQRQRLQLRHTAATSATVIAAAAVMTFYFFTKREIRKMIDLLCSKIHRKHCSRRIHNKFK